MSGAVNGGFIRKGKFSWKGGGFNRKIGVLWVYG